MKISDVEKVFFCMGSLLPFPVEIFAKEMEW